MEEKLVQLVQRAERTGGRRDFHFVPGIWILWRGRRERNGGHIFWDGRVHLLLLLLMMMMLNFGVFWILVILDIGGARVHLKSHG